MSLDVYLISSPDLAKWQKRKSKSLAEAGSMVALFPLIEEYYEDKKPKSETVFEANITHNLNQMAEEAGIYECLWRPEEIGINKAIDLTEPLTEGLRLLKSDPDKFILFNPTNGWGSYINFVPWIERYLEACKNYPNAIIEVSR